MLFERYQYDRTPTHRFVSHSMAKSIVSIAIGMALAEGKIASLDDMVAKYVPKLAGVPYGETSIRNVLRMSSGVTFREVYDGNDDMVRFARLRVQQGSIEALRQFRDREAEQGTRFHYASSETVDPGGAAARGDGNDAQRLSDRRGCGSRWGRKPTRHGSRAPDGIETGSGNFNATLRDYGRLGMLLANDGAVGGRQIVPKDYLLEATDWHRQPQAFAPRRATPFFGYGYQFWTFPGEKRRFALLGVYGQSIFVDPELKLVMVVTAAGKKRQRRQGALWAGARRGLARDRSARMAAGSRPRAAGLPLSLLGPEPRNALSHGDDSGCCHLGAGHFLDLAGGTGAVIDQDALAQSQIDDVLLARHLLCHRRRRQRAQRSVPPPIRSPNA